MEKPHHTPTFVGVLGNPGENTLFALSEPMPEGNLSANAPPVVKSSLPEFDVFEGIPTMGALYRGR